MRKFHLLFGVLFLLLGCQQSIPTEYATTTTEVNNTYSSDAEIDAFIAPYKDSLDAKMNRVIGTFSHELFKAKPESELGNFMSDAMQTLYNEKYSSNSASDFAFTNYGGIRLQHIPAGDIAIESMFELMPFENEVVAVELPGSVVTKLFQRFAADNGWPISDNVRLVIENQQLLSATINGEQVDDEAVYTVLTSDYVANGGDGVEMLKGKPQQRVGIKLRDALIEYVQWHTEKGKPIEANKTGRIIDKSN